MTTEQKRVLRQLIDREMCHLHLAYDAESRGENGSPVDGQLLLMWQDRWTQLNSANVELGGRDHGVFPV